MRTGQQEKQDIAVWIRLCAWQGLLCICGKSLVFQERKVLEQYFSQTGNGMLRERIKRLKLPYHGSFGRGDYIDQLLWGELGDYVRQLLRGSSVGG